MSLMLTFWGDPRKKNTEDDFDEIFTVRLKSVKQIPDLIASRPSHCTMISTEYSGDHKNRGKLTNPQNTRLFKEYWRKGQIYNTPKPPKCPLCGHEVSK